MRGPLPWRTSRARALRSTASWAEEKLWQELRGQELRGRRLEGPKFVRQQPIGPYIADFACREHKIVVEVDGGTHSGEREIEADGLRTRYLEAQGYRVFRAQNADVYENIDGVIDDLLAFVRRENLI